MENLVEKFNNKEAFAIDGIRYDWSPRRNSWMEEVRIDIWPFIRRSPVDGSVLEEALKAISVAEGQEEPVRPIPPQEYGTTNPGWEEEFAKFSTDDFRVSIAWRADKVTMEDAARMAPKLLAIQELAARLSLAMLKGTFKYPSDQWTQEQWEAYEEDEYIDRINYHLLKEEAKQGRLI